MVKLHMLEISPAHPFEIAFDLKYIGQVISIKVRKKFLQGNTESTTDNPNHDDAPTTKFLICFLFMLFLCIYNYYP